MCNAIFITLSNGKKVSYLHTISDSKKNSPTVLFIHGRGGSIHSLRSECVERYCKQNDISFFAFDLLGHGNSDGEKSEILISDWVAQIHEVIDIFYKQLSVSPDTDKMLICGYSMGGYLTCLALREKKILGKIDSVLLQCPAIDRINKFVYEGILSNEMKSELKQQGSFDNKMFPGMVSANLPMIRHDYMKDFQENHNFFESEESLDLDFPVSIIHGKDDDVVDWSVSVKLMSKINCPDLRFELLGGAGHGLNDYVAFDKINKELSVLVNR